MDKRLEQYCELVVRRGINVRKNQTLHITAAPESAAVVRMISEKALAAGAGNVVVEWEDDETDRLRYLHADVETFKKFEPWKKLKYDTLSKNKAAFLTIHSSDPEIFKGVDAGKLVEYRKVKSAGLKTFARMESTNELQWCVCAVPSEAWARKVFPREKNAEAAVKKLWDAIFACSRVDKNNVFDNWKKHGETLKKRAAILNRYDFSSLIYKNSLGTELEIGLPEGHIWNCATSFVSTANIKFSPNIPTEEIFTAPDRNRAEGVVYGSKPFMYLGSLIEDFAVWFKAGKVVKVKAGKNQELLEKLVSSFRNADRLGEVALVPHNSPISKSGVLFYNTLFDENASCHLAFGRAFPAWVKNTAGKSDAELIKMGINFSTTHNDFMMGTGDLSITGVKKNGKTAEVFVNGNFAF